MPIRLENVGLDGNHANIVYKLTYVRGPSDILVMLAEELKKA